MLCIVQYYTQTVNLYVDWCVIKYWDVYEKGRVLNVHSIEFLGR